MESTTMHKSMLLIASLLLALVSRVEAADLEITITNIQTPEGTLLIAIIDNPDNWLKSDAKELPFKDATHTVSSTDDAVVLITDLPAGSYAISIFHDLNADQEMDTNFIGFPKEPYGFSAPMGKFGPPNFEKAIVTIAEDTQKISIELN